MDRRTFLQQAALALVSVGVSETAINSLSKNPRFAGWLKPYVETLAQTTNRKLALLVGVNEYSEKARLQGCINDVELQKELLVHRFGFEPQDIYTLTDRKATRENIEMAFLEHLTEQAESDDVVLFHFSGYGSQVKVADDSGNSGGKLVNSLVPVDGILPTKKNPAANDLLEDTLVALGRSLKTENLITILDTSFQTTEEILQGNYRIRSYSDVGERPSFEELAFESQLQRSINSKSLVPFGKTATPGIILSAASQNQIALEGTWNNFSAGLLTYALTRYLWQTVPSNNIGIALQQTANNVSSLSEKQQQPKVMGKVKSNSFKNSARQNVSGGEGFIAGVDSKGMLNLKLTALSPTLLDSYKEESCFTVDSADFIAPNLLQLRSLEGIEGKAQLLSKTNSPSKESLIEKSIREAIRILPHNLKLRVALDTHLQRIEKVDATSALANIPTVEAAATAGEAYGDCLLGKISVMVEKKKENEPQASENPSHSYGLYSPRGRLIPKTPGDTNEVIKLAISRLEPYFGKLLAAKWLELTVNDNSSTLPVSATLELANKNSSLIAKTSLRITANLEFNQEIPTLESNTEIKLKIDNKSDRDLYGIIVGVDSNDKFIAFYNPQKFLSTEKTATPESFQIAANNRLTIPESNNPGTWKVSQPIGIAKIYLITATQPFANTLDLIAQEPITKLDEQQLINISNPLEIAQAILQDLHLSSNVGANIIASNTDVYALDVNEWASFQFVYDVV